MTILAAVRNTVTTPVIMSVTQKVARTGGSPIASPVPSLVNGNTTMVQGAAIGSSYTIYSASYPITSAVGTKYGVTSGSFSDTFKDPAELGATCSALGTTAPSSTSSSSSVPSTTTSSSATSTPTLGIKQSIGAYSFQGCYTEPDGQRALTGAVFYNYTGMTLEQCAADCASFTFWGVEYGGECKLCRYLDVSMLIIHPGYCGNSLSTGSVLAPTQSDCSFVCPGNSYEYCGAGDRLEMYLMSSLSSNSSSTSPVSSSGTTSPSSSVTSSAMATQTLAVKPAMGAYAFQGCYTEATSTRALSGAAFYNYTAMTLEMCLSNCAGYTYWGVEYGGECMLFLICATTAAYLHLNRLLWKYHQHRLCSSSTLRLQLHLSRQQLRVLWSRESP